MLADSHLHLFSRGFPGGSGRPLLGAEPEVTAYEAFRAVHNIAAGLVIGYAADGIDPGNNAYISGLAATRPWMATLAYVPPSPAPTEAELAALLAAGHTGIAVYATDPAKAAAVADWPEAAWRPLRGGHALVSFNARPEAMPALAPIVRREAAVRFLFSHLGLPGRYPAPPAAADAAARLAGLLGLADAGNVFVKLSGLYAVSDPAHAFPHIAATPFVAAILERFGAERCLWASDFTPALEHVSFVQTMALPLVDTLAAAERDAVMGGTLLRLLGRTAGEGASP